MKKLQTTIGILLCILGILLLLGLGVFLIVDSKIEHLNSYKTSTENDPSAGASGKDSASSAKASDGAASETENPAANAGKDHDDMKKEPDPQTAAALAALREANAALPQHHIIFVGDSRTVGMGDAEAEALDGCMFIGAVGEGYDWFAQTGMGQMGDAIAQYPQSPVVLNLGVNDLDRISDYLALYQTLADTWPDTQFYFMSVNPVTEKSPHVTNMEITAFNGKLRDAFPDRYLDSNTFMRIKEFESADGVHYSNDTYRLIHDFVVKKLFSNCSGRPAHLLRRP